MPNWVSLPFVIDSASLPFSLAWMLKGLDISDRVLELVLLVPYQSRKDCVLACSLLNQDGTDPDMALVHLSHLHSDLAFAELNVIPPVSHRMKMGAFEHTEADSVVSEYSVAAAVDPLPLKLTDPL